MLFDFFSLVFDSWQQCFVIFLSDLFKIALLLVTVSCDFFLSPPLLATVLCDFLLECFILGDNVMWFFSLVLYSWWQCYVIFFFSALLFLTTFCDFFEWFIHGDNVLWFSSWMVYSWQQCSVIFFLSALLFATMFRDFLLECFTLGNNVLWFPLRALLLTTILCDFLQCSSVIKENHKTSLPGVKQLILSTAAPHHV
jgi:hypothetical protein